MLRTADAGVRRMEKTMVILTSASSAIRDPLSDPFDSWAKPPALDAKDRLELPAQDGF
jgi:hypothetical protein